MRIGLIRHFRVDLKKNRFMSAEEYDKYSLNYDKAGVIENEIVIDELWDKCYCSSLPRAVYTAKTAYHGEIIITDKLVEIPSKALIKITAKLPYNLWAFINRIGWARNHSLHPEGKTATLKRINEALDIVLSQPEKNILIVSHAGTMFEIQKILRQKGFKGKWFLKARNGKLYEFIKS
jgi:broad specificity phosphatase PhoE